MARKRISEPEIAVSQGAGASPVRRKTAVTRKKHTPAISVAESLPEPALAVVATSHTTTYQPSHEDVAALAYSYWVARGYTGGSAEEDWLRAERELSLAAEAANA
jgi:hypothetical protein